MRSFTSQKGNETKIFKLGEYLVKGLRSETLEDLTS